MEQVHKRALDKNLPLLCDTIDPLAILPHLHCLSIPSKEQIEATQKYDCRYVAVQKLHAHLRRNPHAWSQLLSALRQPDLNLSHVADQLDPPLQTELSSSSHHKESKADGHQSRVVTDNRDSNTMPSSHRVRCDKVRYDKVKYDKDTTWNNMNAGVCEILKQLDINEGAEKLAGALDFSVNDFNMIKTHRKDGCGSLALALIEDWNKRGEATLGKLLAVLRQIERIDVLRELEQHTGFKLPDNCDQARNENGDKVSEMKQQPVGNAGKEAQKTSEQLTKSQSYERSEKSGGQRPAQILQKPSIPENLPKLNHPLDRSLSLIDTHPVLEPQTVRPGIQQACSQRTQRLEKAESYDLISQNRNVSVPDRPLLENRRFERVPNDANKEVLRITCIGQESEGPGMFIPVTNNNRSESEETRLYLKRVPQTVLATQRREQAPFVGQERWIGEAPKTAELQALWARAYQGEHSGKWGETHRYWETPSIPGPESADIISSKYTSNSNSHLSEDTLNNNSSIETTLSFPSINNMKSIRRVGVVDSADTKTWVEVTPVTQETALAEHKVDHYRMIGEGRWANSDSDNLSSLDDSSENNLAQGCSSEYSSVIKKANKYLPQLRPEDISTSDDVGHLDGLGSLSFDSFISADDDSLTAGVTNMCESIKSDDSLSADTLTRGVTAATEPVNVVQTDIQEETGTNRITDKHDQSVTQVKDFVVGNLNDWHNHAQTDNSNLSVTVGQGRDTEMSHEHEQGNGGSVISDNSQSFFSNALMAVCNETDSLPWKQLAGGAAILALFMTFKDKK